MSPDYQQLVARISLRHHVSPEQIERRVRSRRAKLLGLISPRIAARSVAATLVLTEAEQRLGEYLAAGARHVTGMKLDDAMAAARSEAAARRLVSVGYWPQPQEAPAAIATHYRAAIEAIAQAGPGCSISVKVDQLDFDAALMSEVLRVAIAHRVRVHFDAQAYDTATRTHALVAQGLEMGADVSATLPARWQRSIQDAERFIAMGIPVRLVKGQGGDPEHPKMDPRACYLALVDCLAGRAAHVGVATHDRRVAEPALRRLLAARTPCSLEQMRSLPRLDFLADALGVPTRVYVAYGRFGLPYALGEVLRRPAILGWVLRDLLNRKRAPESAP